MPWSNACLNRGMALAIPACLAVLSAQVKTTEKKMTDTFFVTSPEHPLALEVTPVKIRDHPSAPAPAPAAQGDLCLQPFCNSRWNSRIGRTVGKGAWSLRWKA